MLSKSILSKLFIAPLVILGGAVLWYTAAWRQRPQQLPPVEQTLAVRVLTLAKTDVAPRIVGHGSIRPENVWSGVVQLAVLSKPPIPISIKVQHCRLGPSLSA